MARSGAGGNALVSLAFFDHLLFDSEYFCGPDGVSLRGALEAGGPSLQGAYPTGIFRLCFVDVPGLRLRRRGSHGSISGASKIGTKSHNTGVGEKTILFCQPLPCNPAAETGIQLLIWCSEGSFSQAPSSPDA